MKYSAPLLVLLLGVASAAPSFAQLPPGDAKIMNSGSTNSPKWTITVSQDGSTFLDVLGAHLPFTLPTDVTTKLFGDLAAAAANGPYSPVRCFKSVSFGTRTTMSWNKWTSPDLSCPLRGNTNLSALNEDLGLIQKTVNVNTVIRDIEHPVKQPPADQSD